MYYRQISKQGVSGQLLIRYLFVLTVCCTGNSPSCNIIPYHSWLNTEKCVAHASLPELFGSLTHIGKPLSNGRIELAFFFNT